MSENPMPRAANDDEPDDDDDPDLWFLPADRMMDLLFGHSRWRDRARRRRIRLVPPE